jgi:enoyl-CoA hydratase
MSDYRYLKVESYDDNAIVRVVLNRPETRNAQNRGLLIELDEAFLAAENDDQVRVVILAGAGPSFSAGHDLGSEDRKRESAPGPEQHVSYRTNGATCPGAESRHRQEWHYYWQNTKRWRELRKITVAEVHGNVFSAGLMLMWACDLIVAADDTRFADVVATRLGMCGVEYFAHPWEFGPRLAKELLLTGDAIDAERAYSLGMVNKVFTADALHDQTLAFARRLAELPTMTSLLVKDSVNHSVDAMGFQTALNTAFALHELNHAHWAEVSGGKTYNGTPEFGVPDWRTRGGVGWAEKDRP